MTGIKGILIGAVLALAVIGSPVIQADTDSHMEAEENTCPEEVLTGVPAAVPEGVLGYYTADGGKTFIPIKEEKGVAERIPAGISRDEYLANYGREKETEAAIVHQVPPAPVVIDGKKYEPAQIHLFDGRQLGFTIGRDGQLYAFTRFSDLDRFVEKEHTAAARLFQSAYSCFYECYNCLPLGYWMQVLPSTTLFNLSPMNEMISSMDISAYADNGITLFDLPNLQGDYFHGYYGIPYPNLGTYGWDNRASSLVVWPQ